MFIAKTCALEEQEKFNLDVLKTSYLSICILYIQIYRWLLIYLKLISYYVITILSIPTLYQSSAIRRIKIYTIYMLY